MVRARLAAHPEVKRVGKFGIVGVLNTAIDFTVLNLLRFGAGWALVPANIVSTTIAMTFSFFANRHVVFERRGAIRRQLGLFLATTAFGLYVLQNLTIELLTAWWTMPLHLALAAVRAVGIHQLGDAFIIVNCAKLIGTLVSLTWNYIMYKKVVFTS